METIIIKADLANISDGYHTMAELYEHRHALFLALMRSNPEIAWWSMQHFDESMFSGWFIAGMDLPQGTVTYHMPDTYLSEVTRVGAKELPTAPEWDGHTPTMVYHRLLHFAVRTPTDPGSE